jgi:hydrogenase-4 membrane subunit HyfE
MENLPQIISIIYEGLAFVMLLIAMLISTAPAVHQMIPLYKLQSISLALITLVTAITFPNVDPFSRLLVLCFTFIPIGLMLLIEPLLVLASVPEDISTGQRIRRLFNPLVLRQARLHAYPVWLAQRPPARAGFGSILLDLVLIILAFIIAFSLVPEDRFTANILAISFSLLLLGLSIMRSKQDIISQTMGLLVMEHGMFLAAIRLSSTSIVIVTFVISLFLYIIITLTILIFLLPDLHRISGTIDIDQQEQLKG